VAIFFTPQAPGKKNPDQPANRSRSPDTNSIPGKGLVGKRTHQRKKEIGEEKARSPQPALNRLTEEHQGQEVEQEMGPAAMEKITGEETPEFTFLYFLAVLAEVFYRPENRLAPTQLQENLDTDEHQRQAPDNHWIGFPDPGTFPARPLLAPGHNALALRRLLGFSIAGLRSGIVLSLGVIFIRRQNRLSWY